MGYVPNTADVIANILQGSANVESIIRTNTLDQMGAPGANLSMNSKRLITMAAGITSTDAARIGQSPPGQVGMPFVISGCVWTADSPGSTLACSMTSGTVMIRGILLTVAAVISRSFAANSETYIDLADNGDGTANITYTAVANWTTSPALANNGTALNTLRVGVISSGATSVASAGIGQGGVQGLTKAAAQPSTTVAAGSNGANITAATLNVAASTSFSSSGGYAYVAHAGGGAPYLIQYTGTGAGTLTGVTVLCGGGTVSTNDNVKGTLMVGMTDSIGNRIYPATSYPGLVAASFFSNAFTTTQTATSPVPGSSTSPTLPFIAPFVVPSGPSRIVKATVQFPAFGSSAVAGTVVQCQISQGNFQSGGVLMADAAPTVNVAGDNLPLQATGFGGGSSSAALAPGTYLIMVSTQAGAAGTISVGSLLLNSFLFVELG